MFDEDGQRELPERSGSTDIAHRLSYFGEHQTTLTRVAQCIAALPTEVREFALDRCRFVSVGHGVCGLTLPGRIATQEGRTRNVWIIVLDEEEDPDQAKGTIAHEIAHAWLGHDRLGLDSSVEMEVEAARLAREWGFKGTGADPEFHREEE